MMWSGLALGLMEEAQVMPQAQVCLLSPQSNHSAELLCPLVATDVTACQIQTLGSTQPGVL